ncbi:dolichyl-phosphate-mannose-protein mannosyltransferase [Actinomyces sp. oral taxon 848 str. F0332]|nr:dolichyl-phosphate-mannose-protein mannosyltransferase [Actinomyces sp. oral taxon 848 str. F0332]
MPLEAKDAEAYENDLRGRLGLLPIGVKLPLKIRRQGWIAAGIAALAAFVTRFWNLNHPHAIIFDETYYVKGAFSLLRKGYEGTWEGAEKANELFLKGDYSALKDSADKVVHPPLGKWIMAAGQWMFGSDNGVGWRFSTAIVGVLAVILVARIAMRMFRSPLLAGFAGIAMALDGMGIVMSRTGILDNILAYFVLLGFWALLLDREHSRAKLAKRVARGGFRSLSGAPGAPHVPADPWGPRVVGRPWLLAAGIFLGFAGGVKWSAIYAVAVFGLAAFAWSLSARRIAGVRLWFGAGVFRDGLPAFFTLVPAAVAAYLAAWIPWFADSRSWGRQLAKEAAERGEDLPLTGAPDAVNSFILYHKDMWHFHHTLSSHHDYQSQMWDWIIQRRPVSFYWLGTDKAPNKCGAHSCVEAITSIGNVAVWWLGLAALIVVVLAAFKHRDWRAWAILAGYGAMWVPWISYTNRTIFQFYAVAFLPYVVLALTFAVGVAAQIVGRAHSGQPRLSFGFISGPTRPVRRQSVPLPAGARSQLRNAIAVRFDDEPLPPGAIPQPLPGTPRAPNATPTLPPNSAAQYFPGAPAAFPNTEAFPSNAETLSPNAAPASNAAPSPSAAPASNAETPSPNAAAHPPNTATPPSDTKAFSSGAVSSHPEHNQTNRFEPSAGEAIAAGADAPLSWHAPGPPPPAPDVPPEFHSPNPAVPYVAAPPQKQWWEPPARRRTGVFFVGLVTAVIVAAAAFWYPLWTGQNISHSFWRLHMWLPSWI